MYDILQFNSDAYKARNDGGFVKVGHWAINGISDFYQLCDGMSPSLGPQEACPFSVVYNTPDNSRPADRPPPIVVQVDHSSALFAFGAALAAVLLLVAGLIYAYQKESLLKSAQPTIMLLITLGELIGAVRVIITGLDLSTAVCVAQEVLGHLAFWLVFTPFILRTWRVNRVMNTTTLSRVKVTLLDILRYVAYIYAAMVVYLAVSVGIDQPTAGYFDETVDNQLYRYTTCNHSLVYLSYPLLGLEAAALSYCLWLAYTAKDLPPAFNDFYEAVLSAIGIGVMAVIMLQEKLKYPISYRFYVGISFGLGIVWTSTLMLFYKISLALLGFKVSSKYEIKKISENQTSYGANTLNPAAFEFDEAEPFIKECMTELRRSPNDDLRFEFIMSRFKFLKNTLIMVNEGFFQKGKTNTALATAAPKSNQVVPL